MGFQAKETACAKAPRGETTWGVPVTGVAGTGYTDGRKGGGSARRGQAMQGFAGCGELGHIWCK